MGLNLKNADYRDRKYSPLEMVNHPEGTKIASRTVMRPHYKPLQTSDRLQWTTHDVLKA